MLDYVDLIYLDTNQGSLFELLKSSDVTDGCDKIYTHLPNDKPYDYFDNVTLMAVHGYSY